MEFMGLSSSCPNPLIEMPTQDSECQFAGEGRGKNHKHLKEEPFIR